MAGHFVRVSVLTVTVFVYSSLWLFFPGGLESLNTLPKYAEPAFEVLLPVFARKSGRPAPLQAPILKKIIHSLITPISGLQGKSFIISKRNPPPADCVMAFGVTAMASSHAIWNHPRTISPAMLTWMIFLMGSYFGLSRRGPRAQKFQTIKKLSPTGRFGNSYGTSDNLEHAKVLNDII